MKRILLLLAIFQFIGGCAQKPEEGEQAAGESKALINIAENTPVINVNQDLLKLLSQKIIFISTRDSAWNIYSKNISNFIKDITVKLYVPYSDGIASVTSSPDGKQIAYVLGSDIYIENLDGTGLRRLTFDEGKGSGFWKRSLTWSTDGNKIAYSMNANIWVYDLISNQNSFYISNGTSPSFWGAEGLAFIRGGDVVFKYNSTWPDIYLSSTHDAVSLSHSLKGGLVVERKINGVSNIYFMDGIGGPLKQLTSLGAQDPSWSADGTKIIFTSYRDEPYTGSGEAHDYLGYLMTNGEIYTMSADGTNQSRITNVTHGGNFNPCFLGKSR